MEIHTITLEHWMCRICLAKGTHDIFKERLALPPESHGQGHSSTKINSNSISIIDALNYFSEFKICKPETVNEPVMLCELCHAELKSCVDFRRKLNEAEALLRNNYATQDSDDENEEAKTGLTVQMIDIEPFLDEDDSVESESPPIAREEIVKSTKLHHAKPRFQLTNQVSNILRHVTTTSSSSSCNNAIEQGEKRKESDHRTDAETPKKIHRRNSQDAMLEKTLIIPHHIIMNERQKTDGSVEANILPSESNPVRLDTVDIFHCKCCPKAFSTPQHLTSHTKNVHLCQYCSKHFPNVLAKHKHNREEHKTFRCSLCNFESQYMANLRAHMRKIHSMAGTVDQKSLRPLEDTG